MKPTTVLLRVAIAAAFAMTTSAYASAAVPTKNIVLVHGAFADGSGWKSVTEILQKDGFTVSIVQEPETSLEDDVAATNRAIDRLDGPAVLVGHSYGGAVITEAGNNPKVQSLVYIAAFQPDQGESVLKLINSNPGASKGVAPSADGYLFMDPKVFASDFAADLPAKQARFMSISQVPASVKAFTTDIQSPAWKAKPSFAVVATQDRVINPDLERSMYKRSGATVTEVKASHAVFASQPKAVAAVIEKAAQGK
ncbi:pimeloyl-ACP methyl ester carboxylesterase [Pseudomonas sp. JUb42]|jgi:pimeloyl-ACP methyl ester carboxylesterase|uniref:alpha/beta fold hydrolase n=1 Tax=Pseudomonas sp. JUb42 TaxID=2940611 RepID=UPI0021673098|nr:alpha/beta hydrolase [Pseudomonas sp. JUb42]MCS3468901.1 pimeloyl-ACP methyl ester carboxylesterase [Pseudomonas sp. JUb42]